MNKNYETPDIIEVKALDNYLIYLRYKTNEDVKKAMIVLAPALVTTVISSLLATDMQGDILSKLFGGFLIVVAVVSFCTQVFKTR